MLRTTALVLLIQVLTGCAGGYWHRQMKAFEVAGNCERCTPVAGTIESDQVTGAIERRLYNLTGAVVRTASGNRLKADSVRFNGATGAFESADLRGYLLADEVVVSLASGASIQVYAKRAKSIRGGMVYTDAHLARKGTAIRAHRVRSFVAK